ncbi:hypothetical protein RHMOL_Rhmol08G0034300 [Rhododendron molle]|uniref:Uncharacterized protein n=1 Tax=Rhododendron molle TaxID=49168 RepID=A0ACC0MKN1_RHOML|nr:hypothetical protein RHMOL_Rhmol08G0034300 [Rhododendron molle]
MILGYFGACFIALVTIAIFHFIRKWRNPTCINGRLPPGSMGLPLVGETIQFLIPSKSMDVPAFFSKRIKKYGPVFRTSLVGRPVVVSSDQISTITSFNKKGGWWNYGTWTPLLSYVDKWMMGQKKLLKLVNDVIQERRAHPEKRRGDFLDQILDDMKHQTFLTDNSVLFITFGLLLGTVETVSSTITLTIKLLIEHPLVVEELMVIQELLRLGNIAPGILRRAIRDIEVNGYTIPKGWTIFAVPAAIHLNPETYKDPLSFIPWRWKDLGFSATQKNFIPFGGGARQFAGAEFSKLLLALCIHELVTKYR